MECTHVNYLNLHFHLHMHVVSPGKGSSGNAPDPDGMVQVVCINYQLLPGACRCTRGRLQVNDHCCLVITVTFRRSTVAGIRIALPITPTMCILFHHVYPLQGRLICQITQLAMDCCTLHIRSTGSGACNWRSLAGA